jgi:hypothetical protein
MSPTAAVARHLEWLEYALAAARDEEVRRRSRLDKATDKNREKRSIRLVEVTAEVVELAALVTGIKDLQGRGAATAPKLRTAARSSAPTRRRAAVTTASSSATAAAPPTAATPRKQAASKHKATPAKATPKASTTRKNAPKGTKAAATRTPRRRGTTGTSAASAPTATAPAGPTV